MPGTHWSVLLYLFSLEVEYRPIREYQKKGRKTMMGFMAFRFDSRGKGERG
jgi:hypothetical protein